MNAKTQCLRRLGWILAVFALSPGLLLLACNVGEEVQRREESSGNAVICRDAADLTAQVDSASGTYEGATCRLPVSRTSPS